MSQPGAVAELIEQAASEVRSLTHRAARSGVVAAAFNVNATLASDCSFAWKATVVNTCAGLPLLARSGGRATAPLGELRVEAQQRLALLPLWRGRHRARAAELSALRSGRTFPAAQEHWMKAMVQDRYGSSDVLRLDEVARPTPGADEVLVRVRAAGVGPEVWHLMTGRPYLVRLMGLGVRAPKQRVPGRDLAGTVEAVGSAATEFQPGDEVFGSGRGTLAEYACASAADEGKVGGAGVPPRPCLRGRP